MPADARLLRAGLRIVAIAALLGAAGAARAQVFGTAQFQYQDADDVREFVLADGTRVLRRTRSEQLTKSIDLRHQNYLRPNLLMDSNLRFTEVSRPGAADRTRAPAGTLRLLHPSFQLTAQHQPTSTRSAGATLGSIAGADSAGTVSTTRTAESMLVGNASAPGGIQVNASWVQRRREGSLSSPTQTNLQRNMRASLDRDRYSVYALAGDQRQKTTRTGAVTGRQGQYGFGGMWRALARPTASATLQYDLGASRSQPNAVFTTRTLSQTATATGEWRARPTLAASANYNWRRISTSNVRNRAQTDQEGSVLGRWTPLRGASLSTGGGFRTLRSPTGAAQTLEYATVVLAGEGKVRPGWSSNGSATHTTNWDPDRGTYGAQTFSGSSHMVLSRRVSLDATLSLAASGDTAAAFQRWSNTWTSRLSAQLLRTLTFVGGVRTQRVGPGLLAPTSVSRGGTLDASWRPHPRLDMIGNYSVNEALSAPNQVTRTWASTARAQLAEKWQIQGSWTRSAQPRTVRGVDEIVTHDLASGRLLWQPTRWIAATASYSVTDPGKDLESERLEGTFTWSFGR